MKVMETIPFDTFLLELDKKLKSSPEKNAAETIRKMIMESKCPYLQERLEVFQKGKQSN